MTVRPARPPRGIGADQLARYDVPGPRYTSYPPATSFNDRVNADVAADRLAVAANCEGPLALYVHLPFCERRCSFCACNVTVAHDRGLASRYVDRLLVEIGLVAELLGDRRDVASLHLGGGTPTFCSLADLERLTTALHNRFRFAADAELAIECDPRVTDDAQLKALHRWGFRRISLGVQDLDAGVQDEIGRHQRPDSVRRLVSRARAHGFNSINIDLVTGLPGQTAATWQRTLDAVVALEPDRLAVYGFAYVPWVHKHQRRIDATHLPARDLRHELALACADTLTAAGYARIGMDHFALPTDELVVARDAGRLRRTFMGYTVAHADDTMAFGATAISDIGGAYLQNHKRLAAYYAAVEQGRLPVERGYVRTADDELRRFVIGELMCNLGVRFADITRRFGPDAMTRLADGLDRLETGDVAALADVTADGIHLTELGSWFPRNAAMVFDAISWGSDGPPHQAADSPDGIGADAAATPRFSRTV